MIHQNEKEIKRFRKIVKEKIAEYHDEFYTDNTDVGYVVEMITYMAKPKTVKRPLPTVKGTGDVDKFLRAVLDSLTYDEEKNPVGLYRDDAQVVTSKGTKLYVNDENPDEHTIIRITKILLSDLFLEENQQLEENSDEEVKGKI